MMGKKRLRKGLIGFIVMMLMLVNTVFALEPNKVTVHFRVPETWENYDVPQIYYYDAEGAENIAWPGERMVLEDWYQQWYVYDIYNTTSAKVLFNDGNGIQIPSAHEPGFEVTGEMWYKDGKWYTEAPENLIVYFHKPENWEIVNLYYYNDEITGPAWPGVQMGAYGIGDWYYYEIRECDGARVLFNDGNGAQIPEANEPGFEVTGEKWYLDGTWYNNETVPLYVDGRITFLAKDGVTYEQVETMVTNYHGTIVEYIEVMDSYVIEVPYTTYEELIAVCYAINGEDIIIEHTVNLETIIMPLD